MFTRNNRLVAQPTIEAGELEYYVPLNQMLTWAESYELYGTNQERYTIYGDDMPRSRYSNCWYYAKCLICNKYETKQYQSVKETLTFHFVHCSIEHDYVFPASENLDLTPKDAQLQEIIQASQLYDLPMPGYDDHSRCIKQMINGQPLCLIHEGNLQPKQFWMGMI